MDSNAASERLEVAVTAAPMRETGGVRTDLRVDRWDAEQTEWVARKAGVADRLATGVTIGPGVFAHYGVKPYSTTVDENCNLIVIGGWAVLLGGIAGTSITNKLSGTFGRIGIGTSTTAVASTDTSLNGDTGSSSTTSYYQLFSGTPTISTAATPCTLTLSASFGTGNANFAWQEFGTDNWNASGVTAQGLGANEVFLNHGLSAQGTKSSGQTWTATETISFGYPSGSGTLS